MWKKKSALKKKYRLLPYVFNCYIRKEALLAFGSIWVCPMKKSEGADGWTGKALTRPDSASFCGVNDLKIADSPYTVNSNSVGGSNGMKCEEMAFGLPRRKEMIQLCWLLLSGPRDLWKRLCCQLRTIDKEDQHYIRAKLLAFILKNK